MDTVVSGITDRILACFWEGCNLPGRKTYSAVVHEAPGKDVTFLFCGDRHKLLWTNSHKQYGDLASGDKSTGGLVAVRRPWPAAYTAPNGADTAPR